MFDEEAASNLTASQSSIQVSVCVRMVKGVTARRLAYESLELVTVRLCIRLDISSQPEDSSISYDRIFFRLLVSPFNERRP